jgi:hypothetical protein
MTDHPPAPALDPTRDAALLLQRMGFFTLGVALPISAMLSRRAAVVLAPIGVALLVIAAFLLEPDRFFRSLRRRMTKLTTCALAVLAGWAFLSGGWAPREAAGADRALNMLFALALGLAGVAALSEKTRTANLNAVAIGLGLSALLGVFIVATGVGAESDGGQTLVVRAMALGVVLTPPVAGWLLLRGRNGGAGLLMLAAALAVGAAASPVVTTAFLGALAAALLVFRLGSPAVRWLSLAVLAVVLLAPLAALAARGSAIAWLKPMAVWGDLIARAPAQLVTGFGFDAIQAQGQAGLLPPAVPGSILFEIWHELGLVGAAAFGLSLLFAMRAVLVLPRILQAGAIAAYVAAFLLAVLGLASLRAWWLMTIAAAVILTTAVARGHGRTSRPVARFVRESEGASAVRR